MDEDQPALPRRGRVGVFGGTFDPPHVGHLWLAAESRRLLELDTMLLVVAADPWQKRDRGVSAASIRFEMVQRAVEGIEGLEASDLELDVDGPTYTIETLERLRRLAPQVDPVLILGSDSAANLATWHRYSALPELCEIVVADRPGSAVLATYPVPVRRIEIGAFPVSSTMIRQRVSGGDPVDVLCSPGVVSSIRTFGLYRER